MSSILKALKKLEREKSGRFPDSFNIDAEILKNTDPGHKYSLFTLAMLFLLVFAVGVALTFFALKPPKLVQTSIKAPPTLAEATSQPPTAVIKPEIVAAEIVVKPARKHNGTVAHKQQQKKLPVDRIGDNTTHKQVKASVAGIADKSKEINDTLPDSGQIPTLRVNGIAFQNNAAQNVAIVNGATVSRGSIVNGVTVEEIRSDRIIFQRNGTIFEIQLGQSNK